MIFPTILFLVTIVTSATSLVMYPEKLQGYRSEYDYYLQPRPSEAKVQDAQEEANDDSRSYINKNAQSEDGMYRNNQEDLDDISRHNSYRVDQKERKESNDDNVDITEYNEPKHEDYQAKMSHEINKEEEDDNGGKASRSENLQEEKRNEEQEEEIENSNLDNEKGNEQINSDEDNNEEIDEKTSANYKDSKEHDEFKWPDESEWSGLFGKYKGYDDLEGDRFGKFGKFGRLGEYTGFGGHMGFGCLALGHGEYC